MNTEVAWGLIHRSTHLEPFSIQTNHATGTVACLRIFPGIEPRMVTCSPLLDMITGTNTSHQVEAVLRLYGIKGLVL